MKKLWFLVFFVVLATLLGCGEPVIDAHSRESIECSIKRIQQSLPQSECVKFDEALQILVFKDLNLFELMAKGPDVAAENLYRPLDGKTAKQVIAAADHVRSIRALLAEAEELKKSKKLHGAVEKYEQILELDSELVEAKKGLQETQTEIELFAEKQAYIHNVVLYDLKAKYHRTYLDERVPGVEFKLRNKGTRTLNEVEVTVYFKNAAGIVIAEEDYHPVLVTEYSFSSDSKSLKPNYIWQMEKDHFYQAKSVPTEWKEGAVSAKITNIEFVE